MWAKCRGLGGAHRESEGGVWPARPPREHWEPMGLVANVVRMTGVAGRCTTSSLCRRMWTRAWTKAWTRGRGSLQMMRGLGSGHVRGACVAWRPRGSEAWRVCRRARANMLLQQTTRHERGATRDVSVAVDRATWRPDTRGISFEVHVSRLCGEERSNVEIGDRLALASQFFPAMRAVTRVRKHRQLAASRLRPQPTLLRARPSFLWPAHRRPTAHRRPWPRPRTRRLRSTSS